MSVKGRWVDVMEAAFSQVTMGVLASTTTFSILHLFLLPKTTPYAHKTAVSLSVFTGVVSGFHHYLLYSIKDDGDDVLGRSIIRHFDWMFTIPVTHFQVMTIYNQNVTPELFFPVIPESFVLVTSSLMAETAPSIWIKVVAVPIAIYYGGRILYFLPQHVSSGTRYYVVNYTCYSIFFVLGVVYPERRRVVNMAFEAFDAIAKTVTSLVTIVKAYEHTS